MSEKAAWRLAILHRLSDALRTDERLAGAVLVGSGAYGFRDDESDIDMAAPVAKEDDAATVFRDWKERIAGVLPLRYEAATEFTERHNLLVLLCEGGLEIDLSFPSMASLVALTPNWRVLWERSEEVSRRLSLSDMKDNVTEPEELVSTETERPVSTETERYIRALNRVVHRGVYTAKALRRGEVWKALLLLDELRCRVLQLALLDISGNLYSDPLGPNGVERHADALPPDVLAALSRSVPREISIDALRDSVTACMDVVFRHTKELDRRYGVERSEELAMVLGEFLR